MSDLKQFTNPEIVIKFTDTAFRSLQLQLQLHIDKISKEEFFHSIVTAYVQRHPDIVNYVKDVKAQKKEYPKAHKKKVAKTYTRYEAII